MKCYIVTFYQYENYGTRLQNFALSYVLRKLGTEPVTLALFGRHGKYLRMIKDICSCLPVIHSRQKIWKINRKKRWAFQSFNKKLNIVNIKYHKLFRLDFSGAIALAGSDQIWSPVHLRGKKHEAELYFLRFVPSAKRFAYAPSFGVNTIPEEMKNIYGRYLSEFERLSVREGNGQKIIFELIGKNVDILPDPVFLLGKREWINEINREDAGGTDEKYIVVYFLSNQDEKIWEKIRSIAKSQNTKIIHIAGNYYRKGAVVPTPDEFVRLICSAQAVFTDSFHGVAFSIIMQTPFIVFPRKDVEQFSRIETLLDKYNCHSALADDRMDYGRVFQDNIDFTSEVAESEKKKGMNYLDQIIRLAQNGEGGDKCSTRKM